MTRPVVHTILDAALKVVDDGSEDGRQVHLMSALSKTQSEQLIPAGSHQTGVCLLTEKKKLDECEHVDNNALHSWKGHNCIMYVFLYQMHSHPRAEKAGIERAQCMERKRSLDADSQM